SARRPNCCGQPVCSDVRFVGEPVEKCSGDAQGPLPGIDHWSGAAYPELSGVPRDCFAHISWTTWAQGESYSALGSSRSGFPASSVSPLRTPLPGRIHESRLTM